jgi:hypothetical protein
VIYVDNDPTVLAESTEMLRRRGETNVVYVDGDIREPSTILGSAEAQDMIDFQEPVAYMHAAVSGVPQMY